MWPDILAIYVGCKDSSEILQSAAQPLLFSLKKHFVDNLLNNKTFIVLNLAEYRLILASYQPSVDNDLAIQNSDNNCKLNFPCADLAVLNFCHSESLLIGLEWYRQLSTESPQQELLTP